MAEIREGTLINDRYEVRALLGTGGFACVWQGHDRILDRDVAIKRLTATSVLDPTRREETIAEARKIALLSHPNIVLVFDVPVYQDEVLIIMEFLPGGSLQDYLRDLTRRHKWVVIPESLEILKEILSGLNAAHTCDRGSIIHRDIKPLNILFDKDRHAKIADFGLAAIGVVDEIQTAHPGRWQHSGTFGYKSPEQLKGTRIDQRSDLFNVGLLAYLLFGAVHPFSDPRFLFDYREMILEPYRTLPPISAKELPKEIEKFCATLLEIDPDKRFSSASETSDELENLEDRYNTNLLDRCLDYHDSLRSSGAVQCALSPEEIAYGIALCKKSQFYIQGVFLFEKSGMDISLLPARLKADLLDAYQTCKRRVGQEVLI